MSSSGSHLPKTGAASRRCLSTADAALRQQYHFSEITPAPLPSSTNSSNASVEALDQNPTPNHGATPTSAGLRQPTSSRTRQSTSSQSSPPRPVDFQRNCTSPRSGNAVPNSKKFPLNIQLLLLRTSCVSSPENTSNFAFIVAHYEREETTLREARARMKPSFEARRKIDLHLDYVKRMKNRFTDLVQGDYSPKVVQRKLEEIYAEPMPDF